MDWEARQDISTKYDLICNICHDSQASASIGTLKPMGASVATDKGPAVADKGIGGSYRCHLLNKGTGQWFELSDLHVTETIPQLVGLSESYILVYEKKGLSVSSSGSKL